MICGDGTRLLILGRKCDFPGSPRYGGRVVLRLGKAYVGTGWDPLATNDFYELHSTPYTGLRKATSPGQGH